MQQVLLYHGSGEMVMFPEIRKTRYTKDFSWGFYCTRSYGQACRWARRKQNAEHALGKVTIKAQVKAENKASNQIFTKAGYEAYEVGYQKAIKLAGQ